MDEMHARIGAGSLCVIGVANAEARFRRGFVVHYECVSGSRSTVLYANSLHE
jgi:hypothetical protein